MATASYIASALPSKIVRVSGSNLFRVAAVEMGDSLQWHRNAALNGILDPWIGPVTGVRIPQQGPANGGIPDG